MPARLSTQKLCPYYASPYSLRLNSSFQYSAELALWRPGLLYLIQNIQLDIRVNEILSTDGAV